MMETVWKLRQPQSSESEAQIEEIAEICNVPKAVARIALSRGCEDAEAAMAYLEPNPEDFYDPWMLPDMRPAVTRLLQAKALKQKVCVYGDYDVDGTTAVSMLLKYLGEMGLDVCFKIPNRLTEGYGMNAPAVRTLAADGVKLIVTVDNGIAAKDEILLANALGTDVIVTDHHECQGDLPEALAVIDAKRPDSAYPFSELCGAGIALKLIQALQMAEETDADLREYIECAAMATVADIVPLQDENRLIVRLGLTSMNEDCQNPGIKALKIVSDIETVTAGNVGYVLAPKINAAGRLGVADRVVDLYTGTDAVAITAAASFLKDENEKRQAIEKDIYDQAYAAVQRKKLDQNVFILTAGEGWHSGVIGIVASRLQETWYHPVIVVGIDDDGMARGSCRSVEGINVFEALSSCASLFETYGGHAMAAGFSIRKENIAELTKRLAAWATDNGAAAHLKKTIYYDGDLTSRDLDWALMDGLAMCEPYGVANPGPVFQFAATAPSDVRAMGKDGAHLSFRLGNTRCIAFGAGDQAAAAARGTLLFLAAPKINHFRGQDNIELVVRDLKPDPLYDNRQCWHWFHILTKGPKAAAAELPIRQMDEEALLPGREALVAVYSLLKHQAGRPIAFDVLMDEVAEINSFQLLLALEAFREIGIIQYRLKKGVIFSKICKTEQKKDIKKAPLVIKLKKYLLKKD
jgi:single-stranded-DNA-specific exonuclease